MVTLSANGSTPTLLSLWNAGTRPSNPFLWDALLQVAFEHLQGAVSRGSRVVDIGCGEGHITQVFAEQGCRVTGIDVHLPTLRVLREHYPDVEILTADAEKLPLPAESADVIFSFSTFQYVDRSRALTECRRVLRPGGRFAIVENLAGNPVTKAYRAWHRMSGRQYPENLTPRNHLTWEARSLYESHFSGVRYEAFHLLTPLLATLSPTRGSPDGRDSGLGRMVRAIDRLERGVVRALPFTRAVCWHVVVCGVK